MFVRTRHKRTDRKMLTSLHFKLPMFSKLLVSLFALSTAAQSTGYPTMMSTPSAMATTTMLAMYPMTTTSLPIVVYGAATTSPVVSVTVSPAMSMAATSPAASMIMSMPPMSPSASASATVRATATARANAANSLNSWSVVLAGVAVGLFV